MTYDYLNWIKGGRRLSIAMVCDFFYPNVGGVETHIYSLSQCLIRLGHRVIVITHSYGSSDKPRQGIRHMASGLKVYYLPLQPFYKQTIFFTLLGTLSVVRDILIREQVDVVHGHSSFSELGHESVLHAQAMGIRTVVTDHSLFGFADLSAVTMNKLLEAVHTAVDGVICVSHTCKENSVLRLDLDPGRFYVIPNAIDSSSFTPDLTKRDPKFVTVVVVSRLVYRKGIDLLVAIIPALCSLYPNLRFIIGGDGPKRLDLEEVREQHRLHSRITLLGKLDSGCVRDVLVQGDIFLNTSLTEAFCIALLEAVSCGLLVVSTSVGGVPEVLPNEFIRLAPASPSALAKCLSQAIQEVLHQRQELQCVNTPEGIIISEDELANASEPLYDRAWRMHRWVRDAYSWSEVAQRTEVVYNHVLAQPPMTYDGLLKRLAHRGGQSGRVLVVLAMFYHLFFWFICWLRPEHTIDKVPYLHFSASTEQRDTGSRISHHSSKE